MQKIGRNIFSLGLSRITSGLLLFFVYAKLASYLEPAGFGKFSLILAYYTIFLLFVDFGISRYVIKKISEEEIDILVQTIRPIQAIITDGGQWQNLNSRRKEIARSFYMEFADVWGKYNLKINNSLLTDFLNLNAELLENDKMKNSVESVKMEISERILSLADNKHLPEEQRSNYRNITSVEK